MARKRVIKAVEDLEDYIPQRQRSRVHKQERVIKPKFVEEREISLPPIVAKTAKQKEYMRMLADPSIQIIVCTGFHGSGKTFIPSAIAADKFRKNEIKKIIVARPYVQTGKSSGMKPGSSLDKLYPYVRNVLDTIKNRIGQAAYEIALKDGLTGALEVQEIESIRGRSFDEPSWLIADEMQQSTPDEMKSIVTRISDECKLILCGDVRQKDIRGESGLEWFLAFAKRHNLKGVGLIDFSDPEDIVRGKMVRDIAVGMMKDEQKEK